MAMAMARPVCKLLLCLLFIVHVDVVAARPLVPVVPIAGAARPPPPPPASASACAETGVKPLTKPLAFCGGKTGEPTCCDAANDSTISLAFVSRPSTHDTDADAASCAAALVKWNLCAACFPADTSLAAPCAEQLGPAPSPPHHSSASVVGAVIGSVLGAAGAVLLAWFIWKKILQDQEEGCSTICYRSTVCSCSCCNNTTIWCY